MIGYAMTQPVTLKVFIQEYMRLHGIDSATKFAEEVGVTPSTITRYLNDPHPPQPSFELLAKLSDATNTDFLYLVQIAYPDMVKSRPQDASARLLAERIAKLPSFVRDVIERLIDSYLK